MSTLFRAALALAILLAVLALPQGTPAATNHDLAILHAASLQRGHASAASVVTWLRRQAEVRAARVATDHQTIRVTFRDGFKAAILPKRSPVTVAVPRPSPAFLHRVSILARSQDSTPKALVLEPYLTELYSGQTDIATPIISALQAAGFSVTHLTDTQVSVASMKTLSQYNLVYYEGHNGPGLIGTGQLYPGNVSDVGALAASVAGSTQTYYAVTPTFFQAYLGTFPDHSLVFMNGCDLLGDTATWNTLHDKGVSTMVAWNGDSNAFAVAVDGNAFFNVLTQGKTVADTLSYLIANGLGTAQQQNGKTSQLGFNGDGSLTLAEIAAGSTPPVTVTVPPTTAPPTSTPTPTPTLTPLRVTTNVRHRVKPGTRQVVTVHTDVPAAVSVHVAFPSGGGRTLHGTTDASGNASFSYVQPADRITRGHLTAHLTIEASADGRTVSTTAQYHILFSPLDVSVVPHVVAVGQPVAVWVHTRAHTHVVVSVHFANGRVFKYNLHTGRRGWGRHAFTLPKAVKGATVRVRARARVHGKIRHGSTSLIVG